MANDNKIAQKSDPNENPWTDLKYGGGTGSNQVTAVGADRKIKPTALQNASKLFFPKLPANF